MQFRWYQDEAVTKLVDYVYPVKKGDPVIELPTGTGKSVIPPLFIMRILNMAPNARFLIAAHREDLISQNHEKMQTLWPDAPAGIYSAALDRRDTHQPITFVGIDSVYKRSAEFGWIDALIVDECHLVSDKEDSMYLTFIAGLKLVNPNLVVIGLSATAYRGKESIINGKGVFTESIYSLCTVEGFNRLLKEGFLSHLIAKRQRNMMDVSRIHIRGNDYSESETEAEADRILLDALQELCEAGQDRHSWLIFGASVANSDKIAQILNSWGFPSASIHSKRKDKHVKEAKAAFKAGKLRCLVNYGQLTTGFDHPNIDLLAIFRVTRIPSLHVQILGRGTRPVFAFGYDLETIDGRLAAIAAGPKQNCLVLDFAGNIARLGPINAPMIKPPSKKKKGDEGPPVRICDDSFAEMIAIDGSKVPGCGAYNAASARVCDCCGLHFPPPKIQYASTAYEGDVIQQSEIVIKSFEVSQIFYSKHQKLGKPPILKVQYRCGLQMFNEFVPLEGEAKKLGRDWWRRRHDCEKPPFNGPPPTVDIALAHTHLLQQPKRLQVHVNLQYPKIHGYEW